MSTQAITDYANKLDPSRSAICHALQREIDAALPQATSKLWHAIPVWFVGPNPVVGYTARKEGVMLMFWNGQRFDEPELQASGTFHVAQIRYDDAAQIDSAKLAGWLMKAGTNIWDITGERAAFVAARRKAKEKAKAKAKAKARPKAKSKPKAKIKKKAPKKLKRKAAPRRKK